MRQPRLAGVYGLLDPEQPEVVRYVGTSNHLAKRLSDHAYCIGGKHSPHRKDWIKEMRDQGRKPVMVVLQELDSPKASFEMHSAERDWIERFRVFGQADLNRTLLSEEREFLIAHIKKLQVENAKLRKLLVQRATQRGD
jgi:hypothetical protein